MTKNKTTFDSGAQRISDLTPRYCDIPPVALRRIAMIFNEGAAKYGVGNWEKGLPWDDTYNHLQEHINEYNEGDRTEDHLAKAAWGLLVQMCFEDKGLVETIKPEYTKAIGLGTKPIVVSLCDDNNRPNSTIGVESTGDIEAAWSIVYARHYQRYNYIPSVLGAMHLAFILSYNKRLSGNSLRISDIWDDIRQELSHKYPLTTNSSHILSLCHEAVAYAFYGDDITAGPAG